MLQFNFLSMALFLTGIIAFILALISNRKINSGVSRIFSLLMLSFFLYSMGYGFELLYKELSCKLFWVKVQYAGISFIPALWLIFALSYSSRDRWLQKPFLAVYLAIPLLTLALKITDEAHNLIYQTAGVAEAAGLSILVFTRGPWYLVNSLYMIAALVAGLILILKTLVASPSIYKPRIRIILAGALIPITAFFAYLFFNPPIDLTPFAFFFTGILSFAGLAKLKILELMPVARSAAVESMQDGFMVIDNYGRIADVNNSFLKMLSLNGKKVLGQPYEKALDAFPGIKELCRESKAGGKISTGGKAFFDVRVTPVKNLNGQTLGKLAIFQDVSIQTAAEKTLERNEKFRRLLVDTAAKLINITHEKAKSAVNEALAAAGKFTGVDRAYIFRYNYEKRTASNIYEWCAEGVTPQKENLQDIPFEEAPEFLISHRRGKIIYIQDVSGMPSESSLKALLEKQGIKTLITLPMLCGGKCIGFAGLDAVREKRTFTNEEIDLLKVLAEIFTNTEMHIRKDAELKESQGRYNLFFDNAPLGIVHMDKNGEILKVNKKFAALIGAPEEKITGINVRQQIQDVNMKQLIKDASEGKTGYYEGLYVSVTTGKSVYIKAVAKSILDDRGDITGAMGIFEDITDKKRTEEQLRYDALHDPLTRLANRALLMDRLERVILRSKRKPADHFILMFLDLDDFKKVNDSLGHAQGDNLLRDAAKRLAGCLRPEDTLARLGGDEFAILLEALPEFELGTRIAKRILTAMQKPFELARHKISTTVSIGICHSSEDIEGANEYLRNADMAMYQAKKEGKNRFAYFSPSMHEKVVKKLTEETYLWETVKNKQLSIFYQPMVELDTETVVGYEALLRWNHPEKGLLMPGDFIPLAEETGLIVSIGEWVLENACRQKWILDKRGKSLLNLHINISARQLYSEDIVAKLGIILRTTGFPAESLCLEITESILMSQNMAQVIMKLKSMGLKIFIDDFGTGFSSLSYLHRYPVDGIKIDKTFVARMLNSKSDSEIVRAIIALGQALQMPVTAEGVETREQAEYLKKLECRFAQGFLWGLPAEITGEN